MNKRFLLSSVAAAVALALAGCGGSDSATTVGATNSDGETLSAFTTGFSLPSEISAVPANNTVNVSTSSLKSVSGFGGLLRAVGDLSATSDYQKANTAKYVEERALEQFDIIETIMNSLTQTNYADSANINQGPYKAVVSWEEESGGSDQKTLEPWVVDSRMIEGTHPVSGSEVDVNKILVWIEEVDGGQTKLIKAEFLIFEEATLASDGSVSDYGVWDMNVRFDDAGAQFFAAEARKGTGETILKINANEGDGTDHLWQVQAVLHRAATTGYGKVKLHEEGDNGNYVNDVTATYAYNDKYLIVDDGAGVEYKNRTTNTEMTHRYGLFYATADSGAGIAAGDNVMRHKSFGFPFTYTNADGQREWGYYGAWQGRHQIWGPMDSSTNQPLDLAGETVTREDFGSNTQAETYTVSAKINGTLSKRSLTAGSLADIADVPMETWLNEHYQLIYDGTNWVSCNEGVDWSATPACFNGNSSVFTLSQLVDQQGDRQHININGDDNGTHKNYVYDGTNFYEATHGQDGWQATATMRPAPATGDLLWVNIDGSIYIEYDSTNGWQQKTLTSFDSQNYTPEFGTDTAFSLEINNEYYLNANGVNYIVKTDGSTTTVAMEAQTVANPSNMSGTTFFPVDLTTGAYFKTPWDDVQKYVFDTTTLNLKYSGGEKNGQAVTDGVWGLEMYDSGDAQVVVNSVPVQFNWEYSNNGGWGAQQYLINADTTYKLLDDPIQLASQLFEFPDQLDPAGPAKTKTLKLAYDGWLHGMPDLYRDLEQNGWSMTDQIRGKIINLAAGTEVTDAADSTVKYYLKPLEVSLFLADTDLSTITGLGHIAPTLDDATAVSLLAGDMPTYDAPTPAMKNTVPTKEDGSELDVKYSEGVPVD